MNRLVFDLETTGLSHINDTIVCIGYKYNDEDIKVVFPNEDGWTRVIRLIGDATIEKVAHNLCFDKKMCEAAGIPVRGPVYDTQIVYHSKFPFRSKKLDEIKEEVFKWRSMTIKKAKSKYKVQHIHQLPREFWHPYCAQDVDATSRLRDLLGEPSWWVTNVEFPLIDATIMMETSGWQLDNNKVHELYERFTAEMVQIEMNFPLYVPKAKKRKRNPVWEHNTVLNSPKELREWLQGQGYAKLLAKYLTSAEVPSTDKLAMRSLARTAPVAQQILRYRQLGQLVKTYLRPWLEKDVLYGGFNQCGTKSGRYSSSGPNMQNIPVRTPDGKLVRSCIVARPGKKLIVADLSQIEPRLYAHFSQDPQLLTAVRSGDFHAYVMASIRRNGAPFCDRFTAKQTGLATLYQVGDEKAQNMLAKEGIFLSISQIQSIKAAIKVGFKVANDWSRAEWARCFPYFNPRFMKEAPKGDPVITTICNRRIEFEYKTNPVNYRMQGSCADIMKIILLNLYQRGYKILGMVHDEAIIEVDEDKAIAAQADIVYIMTHSFIIPGLPLPCTAHTVNNWAEAK